LNTQTHILLASAALIPVLSVHYRASVTRGPMAWLSVLVVFGAVLPDASLVVMWLIAKAQNVPDEIIFGQWYYSDYWTRIGAMSNSIPVFSAVAALSFVTFRVWANKASVMSTLALGLMAVSLSALLHTITDFPLHHNDGHAHFWPLSRWIFESPVSYWDPLHYGRQWTVIELILAGALIMYLWRKYSNIGARALLVLSGLSYIGVSTYWMITF